MKHYKHIFFDLDKTLWDFDRNSFETFTDIYIKYDLRGLGIPAVEDFIGIYTTHNIVLWDLYRNGKIKKNLLSVKRFDLTLNDFGINDQRLAKKIASDYIRISPLKKHLFPQTIETLEYLEGKYRLHIITNGFEEVQIPKLSASGLDKYFKKVITSEAAGCKKPDPGIFEYSLEKANAVATESIMVGDDIEVDIIGAKNTGIDQVYVNYSNIYHEEKATYEINDLKELRDLL